MTMKTWLWLAKGAITVSTTTSRHAILPVSGNLVSLYHPRRQRWAEHFSWNEDFRLVIGLTPTGRATVERLQLNREGVVNLRQVLRTISQHPPSNFDNV